MTVMTAFEQPWTRVDQVHRSRLSDARVATGVGALGRAALMTIWSRVAVTEVCMAVFVRKVTPQSARTAGEEIVANLRRGRLPGQAEGESEPLIGANARAPNTPSPLNSQPLPQLIHLSPTHTFSPPGCSLFVPPRPSPGSLLGPPPSLRLCLASRPSPERGCSAHRPGWRQLLLLCSLLVTTSRSTLTTPRDLQRWTRRAACSSSLRS